MFLGKVSKEKGNRVSYQLIQIGSQDVFWFLFDVREFNKLSMLEKSKYIKNGLYEHEELSGLITQYPIDLVHILPIWPEAYCDTLSEATLCGISSIIADIGALSECMYELVRG